MYFQMALLLIGIQFKEAFGYNINDGFADLIHGPRANSYFGFTLSAHKLNDTIT